MQASTLVRDTQDRLASVLGCARDRRTAIVAAMVHRNVEETTGYWLQLSISAGIAILGLVVGSNAVIIGAMLVAPLMGPIIGLGMGLAVGSPILVFRAALRVLFSVAIVVGISSGITRLLPFHQLTSEIAARTTPTAIDLATAMFCAIAGVYATMRPGSDVTTTAAGTSIGISLVPPLCASGSGVGTDSWSIARSAMLLFLTNFCAIVVIGSALFALAGFGQVNVAELEDKEFEAAQGGALSRPLIKRIIHRARSSGGPLLRLLMPVALLAALFSPLRAGLDLVAWQVAARASVDGAIGALPQRVVQARVRVERREIEVVIFLLGSQADAALAKDRLVSEISSSAGVSPRVDVHAVADANEFEALELATEKPAIPVPTAPPEPPPPPPPPPADQVADAKQVVSDAVRRLWPTAAAGELLDIRMSMTASDVRLTVVHLGAPLDAVATEVLETALGDDFGEGVTITDEAIPAEVIVFTPEKVAAALRVARFIELSRATDMVAVCLSRPMSKPRRPPLDDELGATLEGLLAGHPRAAVVVGDTLTLRFVNGTCPTPAGPEPAPR